MDWRQGRCQVRGIWVSRVLNLMLRGMLSRGTGQAAQQSQQHQVCVPKQKVFCFRSSCSDIQISFLSNSI